MFSQRDFLRRLIEDFARLLASIMGLRRAGKLDEAERAIAEASGALLGPLARDAESLSSQTLARLLSRERLERYAILLAERAELRLAQGDAVAANEDRLRALELLLEARAKPGNADELSAEVRSLLERLASGDLSQSCRSLLTRLSGG